MHVEVNVELDYETYIEIRPKIREYLLKKIPPNVVKNQDRLRKEVVDGVKRFATKLPVYRRYVFYHEGAVDEHARWIPNRGRYALWKALHYPFAKILELTGEMRDAFSNIKVHATKSLDAVVHVESRMPDYWRIHDLGTKEPFVPRRDFTFLTKNMRIILAYDVLESARGFFKKLILKYANYFFRFYVNKGQNDENNTTDFPALE